MINYHNVDLPKMDIPFPALTPEQRLHFDIYGYVVIHDVLTPTECTDLIDVLQHLKKDLLADDSSSDGKIRAREAVAHSVNPNHIFMCDIEQAHPLIASYITHPRLLGMSAEIVGGEIRLVEANAHINSRLPDWEKNDPVKYGFHDGVDTPYGSHYRNGLYHSCFVKTLTNLTELGPDDGGTVVIAGSHKIDLPNHHMEQCAYKDRSLIHQMIAPAGSTLLFAESLAHTGGHIRSEKERVNIINGYGPSHLPYWGDGVFTDAFNESIPDNLKILFHGRQNWSRMPKERSSLMQETDERPFELGDWRNRDSKPSK